MKVVGTCSPANLIHCIFILNHIDPVEGKLMLFFFLITLIACLSSLYFPVSDPAFPTMDLSVFRSGLSRGFKK